MNPWLILGAVILWVVSSGAVYVKGQSVGANRVIAEQAKVNKAIDETRAAAQQGAAAAIAANRPINNTIVQKVQHEIRTERVYSDCRVPASGLQLANQAITGRPAEPAGGGSLPSADAPKR